MASSSSCVLELILASLDFEEFVDLVFSISTVFLHISHLIESFDNWPRSNLTFFPHSTQCDKICGSSTLLSFFVASFLVDKCLDVVSFWVSVSSEAVVTSKTQIILC